MATALVNYASKSPVAVDFPIFQTSALLSLRSFTTEQRGTTVLCVRKLDKVGCMQNARLMLLESKSGHCIPVPCLLPDVQVVIMADGQVTRGNEVVKPNVKKVRKLNDNVIGGFAGQSKGKLARCS